MGYRSDVILAYQFDNRDSLVAFATKLKLSSNDAEREAAKEYRYTRYRYGRINATTYVMYAQFEAVKWYDSYADVASHKVIHDKAIDHGAATLYLRIGEEPDDIEANEAGYHQCVEYVLPDLFSITRNIHVSTDVRNSPVNEL